MKKIMWLFCLLLSGCYVAEIDSDPVNSTGVESLQIDCVTCRDILGGEDFYTQTACNGTAYLWLKVQNWACRPGAQCYTQCGSLCSYNGISQACEACLLLPSSRQDYLDCNMVGNE